MNKYVLGIDGMMCGMCEAHVQNAIMKAMAVKKAKASHSKNELIISCEQECDENDCKAILDPTGYRLTSFRKEEAKKTLLGWK